MGKGTTKHCRVVRITRPRGRRNVMFQIKTTRYGYQGNLQVSIEDLKYLGLWEAPDL